MARKGRKIVVAGPWTPRKHAFKDITADVAMSKVGTHLRVLESDTALLASQSPTAGSLPSPTEAAVTLVQPRDLTSTLLSVSETVKVVRSVAARVHHCDELLDMLHQEAVDDEERRATLLDTHQTLVKQVNKIRGVLLRCADGMGMGDEVAELLHDTLPLPKPRPAGARIVVKKPSTATVPVTVVSDAEAEGGGRCWSPSPPPSTAGGIGSRSSRQHCLPIGSAESFAARPHTASSNLTAWTDRHPYAVKFATRPRDPGLARPSARSVVEDASFSGWKLDSTSSILSGHEDLPPKPASPKAVSPARKTLRSLGLDPSDLESCRRSQHTGSWRQPRVVNASGRRCGKHTGSADVQAGGEESAPWRMAVRDNSDRAAKAAEAEQVREDALSNIGFRNGEPMVLSMPRMVVLHCADETDAEERDLVTNAVDSKDQAQEQHTHEVEDLRDSTSASQQPRRATAEGSYSKSNFLSLYEHDQARQRGDFSLRLLPKSSDEKDGIGGWGSSASRSPSPPLNATEMVSNSELQYHTSPPVGYKHNDGSVRIRATDSMEQCWAVQDYLRRSPEPTQLSAQARAAGVAGVSPYRDRAGSRSFSSRDHDASSQRRRCLSRAEQIQCAIRLRPTAHASTTKWPARSTYLPAAVALA
eukprot:COSAG02_NODE_1553_length_11961_cov_5.094335_16_plen_644_part_00